MAARVYPNPLPEAPAGKTRLPCSRSEAFRIWMIAVAATALLQITVVALLAAFPAASAPPRDAGELTFRVLAVSALVPVLFLFLARFAERRYQRRPTKPFQISQFGLYLAGTAFVGAGFLQHRVNFDPYPPLLFAGEILLGTALVLLAAWIASVILCTPTRDTLTTP
jgi:hypothetical protein